MQPILHRKTLLYHGVNEAHQPSEQSTGNAKDPDDIKLSRRKHPRATRPAEFQGPGILQLEYSYDGNFFSQDLRSDQSGSLSLSFPVTQWLLLEASTDTVLQQTDRSGLSNMSFGDTRTGFQITALEDSKRHPSVAFAYVIKLPSASEAKGLGTGRTDHQIMGLASKKMGETDLDFNLGLLVNGRETSHGHVAGAQVALGFSRDTRIGFGVQGEISAQSIDTDQPRGIFALGALNFQFSRRFILDFGMRCGLNPSAPRFGVFFGITLGVANLYRM